MNAMDRGYEYVPVNFDSSTTSDPIFIGNRAWGSISTPGTIGWTTLTPKGIYLTGESSKAVAAAATPVGLKDANGDAMAAIGMSADEKEVLQSDIFQYDWIVFEANTSVDGVQATLFLKG